jgi:hypothetical protein
LQDLSGLSGSGITGNSIFGNGGVGVLIRGGGPSVLTLSGNDVHNNTGFELRNESSCTVVADGNYWGAPTNTELANGSSNLTRIYDLRDGASRAVILTDWYASSVVGGSPGALLHYGYPTSGITQTVAGTVTGAATWSGKVLVVGDVTVTGSLTIAPGTEVVFEYLHDTQTGGNDTSRSELILDGGTLTAAGTVALPIVFTSSRTPKTSGDWYGIRVKSGNFTLQNCVVEYAAEGIRFEDTDTRFETYALSDTTVRYCSGNGIWTTSGQYAQPVVLDNFTVLGNSTGVRADGPMTMTGGEVRQNTSTGVYAYQTTLVMNGVAVRYNSGDGIVANRTAATITGCTTSQNNGWGINCDGYGYYGSSGTAQLEDNVVQQNGGGVRIYRWISVGLVGNTISGNNGTGLELQDLAGLSASGITGNSIFGNGGVGVLMRSGGPSVLTLSGNDIHNNTGFELRNESSCTVVADGNYWGVPTNTELVNGSSNLTRIYDLRDGASKQVQIGNWYASSFKSGSPGTLINFTYGVTNVTKIVQGSIATDQVWDGRILVVGDLTVSASLSIQQGTEVIVVAQNDTQTGGNDTSRSELIIDGGTLTAIGTASEPIVFTSSRTPKTVGDWYGIRIKGGNVTLQNCVVEYAVDGIRFEDTDTRFETYALSNTTARYCSGNGIWTTSVQYAQPVVLDNFTVLGNATGVRADGPLTMTGGEVRQNTSTGVYAYQTTLIMNGVAVRYNSGDGVLANRTVTTITGCTTSQNNGWGINCDGYGYYGSSGTAQLEDNVVQQNGGGVRIYRWISVGLVGNTISGNSGTGLELQDLSGLSGSGITGNSIFGNGGVGVLIRGGGPSVLTLSGNDVHNNTGFELRNESSCTVVADGNYWGAPTNTELANGSSNLTRIYDLRDGASRAVILTDWYASSVVGGSPGALLHYGYPTSGITQTVAGTVTGAATWSGKVLVVGDVTVTGSLTIAPGTEVVFEYLHDTQTGGNDTSRSELILDGGTLTAAGTVALPIVFTSSRTPKTSGDWYGIRVKSGNFTLQNCVVEYAAEGIRFEDTDTRFETYALSDTTVRYCSGNGIWTTSGQYAQPVVLDNFTVLGNSTGVRADGPMTMTGGEVRQNTSTGVYAYQTTLVMNGVAVRYNSGDGIVANRTAATITGCTTSQNNGWGINCDGYGYYGSSGTAQLEDNVVQQNGGGVRIYRWISVGLVGNTISGNNGTGLELQDLAGLSASGITGNSIFGNGGVGVLMRSGGPSVLTLSGNDIHNNTGFELRNESSCTVVADGNYWGVPTNTELVNGSSNLTRIYDLRDGASKQVQIGNWYASSFKSGSPGTLINFTYGVTNVTKIVQGSIATDQVWDGRILVVGDLTVSASLSIQQGTEVIVVAQNDTQTGGNDTSRSELIIDGGTLTAIGTASEPIVFTSSRTPKTVGDWYGIRIKGGNVTLQNCVVEYAVDGIRFEDTDTRFETYALSNTTARYCSGNGIWTTSVQYAQPVVLDNFTVLGNATGVRADGPLTMTGGEVRQNTSTGVYAYQTTLIMNGVAVRYNSGDGVLANRTVTTITGCTTSQNNGWGINCDGYGYYGSSGTAQLEDNVVQQNGGGVRIYRWISVGLAGNTLSGNNGTGLELQDLAGLSASGITGNSIFGNGGVGVLMRSGGPSVLTLSGNDIHDNTGFELRNESGISITMENVYLGKVTAREFGKQDNLSRIYDQHDHPSYGQVVVQSLNTGTMLLAPEITSHPQGASVNLGGSLTLTISATGSGPLAYQWYKNGVAISGAIGSSMTLSNFDITKAGTYHAVVSNVVDDIASNTAQVTAILPQDPAPNEPEVLSLQVLSGYCAAKIRGEIGRAYTIEVSDDLVEWRHFQTIILTQQGQIYLDWSSYGKPSRFYRIVYGK